MTDAAKHVELTQAVTEHVKSCERCSNQDICDEGAQLNANLMEWAIFGK